jgi:ADP-ribose pyrophosphatase YjhB (NUDIX family)
VRRKEPTMTSHPRNPYLTVDIIIEYQGGIVLIQRKNPPHGWALPGGFVDYGECLEEAAKREAREETGLTTQLIRQLHTYSNPDRDPRHHTVSTVSSQRRQVTWPPATTPRMQRCLQPQIYQRPWYSTMRK